MSRKSLLVVPTASDERVEASPDQDDDDPVQAVETDDQLDIALRVSTDGQVVSTAPEAPSHDQSTSAANDSGDRDQQTSPQVEPAPDSAVPVAPSKNLGVSLTLGADSKRVKNYRALASSFKYLQPFCRNTDGKYPAKTVCVLCATGKPTSVFFPCQHLCVCNKCIDGNDMSPEFSMDLDRADIRLILSHTGTEEETYWNWLQEAEPPLPVEFKRGFKNAARRLSDSSVHMCVCNKCITSNDMSPDFSMNLERCVCPVCRVNIRIILPHTGNEEEKYWNWFAFYASTMAFDFSSMEAHTCRAGPILRGATVNPGDHAIDASNDIMEEVDKLATQTTLTQRQIWMAIVDKFYMNDGAPVRGVSEKTVKNRVQEAWGHDSSHGRASIMTNPRLTKIKGSHQGFFQFQYAWHDDVKALKKPPKDANGIDQITARDIISRTNNPLERFHRELNKRFNAHPPMKTFVTSLENLAREYVAQRTTVISGLAKPPERTGFVLPRQPKLPEVSDIVDSPASSDGEGEIVDADADSEPYSSAMSSTGDENVEPGEYIQPDHSFEYDGET
ncbi:hypothetical protein PHYSODRAFT_326820 [Phytophthora sojae]|uniref:Uncharacterized protein n=1 Tax=Phytophthora sojae (strain P6497) TaxID=1094619 RepID=G4Z0K5_PHYSP|nr:hypothetical protein PHYSODRAFT_326820 [Phytophthora sojae]EGZ25854.1 hypothetical protein PHYSODRAFT_326820 [Phytophthora sojae]|eukprot:XP_009521142.1 hypothetical protein PHYSODRAFT_326820 [Phytophthora sojae]